MNEKRDFKLNLSSRSFSYFYTHDKSGNKYCWRFYSVSETLYSDDFAGQRAQQVVDSPSKNAEPVPMLAGGKSAWT